MGDMGHDPSRHGTCSSLQFNNNVCHCAASPTQPLRLPGHPSTCPPIHLSICPHALASQPAAAPSCPDTTLIDLPRAYYLVPPSQTAARGHCTSIYEWRTQPETVKPCAENEQCQGLCYPLSCLGAMAVVRCPLVLTVLTVPRPWNAPLPARQLISESHTLAHAAKRCSRCLMTCLIWQASSNAAAATAALGSNKASSATPIGHCTLHIQHCSFNTAHWTQPHLSCALLPLYHSAHDPSPANHLHNV
jgi:hypothetical protein